MCGNEQRLSDRLWMMAVRWNWVGRSAALLLIVTGLVGTQSLSARAQVTEAEDASAEAETLAASQPMEVEQSPTVIEVDTLAITDLEQPATTVDEWVAQIEASLVQIIDVRVEETETGLQIVLETAEGELATPTTQTVGNALIADIPNAVLTLPEGDLFEQFAPAEGIALVSVTNEPGVGGASPAENQVRVAITGTDAPPVAEVNATGLAVTLGEVVAGAEDGAIQVVVTGEQDEGYNSSSATSATRTDTPLRDIPQSIQVIPQEVIEDRQPTDLIDALRTVPGISYGNQGSVSIQTAPVIRGFSASSDVLRDGTRFPGDRTPNIFDSATVERIEVLRGPSSVLFGQGSLGGVINIVSKRPLSDPFYSLEASAGSFNSYRGALDLSGPLNKDRTLLYRLNLAVRTNDTFVDSFERRQFTIAPTIAWSISSNTDLQLSAEYVTVSGNNGQFGLPALGTILPNPNGEIPLNNNLSEPSLDRDNLESFRIGYNLEHRFSDAWQLQSVFEFATINQDRAITFPLALEADNRILRRGIAPNADLYSLTFNSDNYVVGEFNVGSTQHELILGFNYTRIKQEASDDPAFFLPPIDIFSPVYNPTLGAQFFGATEGEISTDIYGFYIQDQISLLDNFILVLNGRYDIVDQRLRSPFGTGETVSDQISAFSPRVGLVYQPIPEISLYGNFGRSFQPTNSVFTGDILPEPERGTLYEIGIKADISESLSATLSFYDQTRSNVLTADPNNPLSSIQVGEQNSQGIEANLTGEILPGWNIVAGYAYTDARITKDNTLEVGNRLINVPEHSFNLWTTYQIQEGNLEGLGFGLGLFYQGDRAGDLGNSFELPGYLRTDAALFYERNQFRAALNFRNLFNIDYFEGALNDRRVFPGAPFEIQGTVSWTF